MPTDPIEAAAKFDEAVRATAVVGGLVEKVDNIDSRTDRIETKVDGLDSKLDHVVSTIDRWGGVAVVVSTLVSIATGVVVWVAGSAIVNFLGLVATSK